MLTAWTVFTREEKSLHFQTHGKKRKKMQIVFPAY